MRRYLSILILMGMAAGWPGNSPAQNIAVTYSYTHADPVVLERTIAKMLPDRHQFKIDRSRKILMVIAPEFLHEQFVPLLKHLDKPAKKIRITAEWLGPKLPSAEKPPVVEMRDNTETRLPLPLPLWRTEWLSQQGTAWSTSPAIPQWDAVAASFRMQPSLVGEGKQPMIRLVLIPELHGTIGEKPVTIRYPRAAIQLFVQSGKSVRIGKFIKAPAFYEQFFAGSARQGQADMRDLVVRLELIEPPQG